jgi:hypothetical protein
VLVIAIAVGPRGEACISYIDVTSRGIILLIRETIPDRSEVAYGYAVRL